MLQFSLLSLLACNPVLPIKRILRCSPASNVHSRCAYSWYRGMCMNIVQIGSCWNLINNTRDAVLSAHQWGFELCREDLQRWTSEAELTFGSLSFVAEAMSRRNAFLQNARLLQHPGGGTFDRCSAYEHVCWSASRSWPVLRGKPLPKKGLDALCIFGICGSVRRSLFVVSHGGLKARHAKIIRKLSVNLPDPGCQSWRWPFFAVHMHMYEASCRPWGFLCPARPGRLEFQSRRGRSLGCCAVLSFAFLRTCRPGKHSKKSQSPHCHDKFKLHDCLQSNTWPLV